MIPYSVVRSYSVTLDQLSMAALSDLRGLLDSLADESPERQRAVLFEAFPEVFNPYAAASSAVSASFYDEVRDLADVKAGFIADTLETVDTPRWHSLVGAGTVPAMFEQSGSALMYSFLSGGVTRLLTEMAADTIAGNGALDPSPMGYQRVPKPGCCAFCGMVASKGDLFGSKSDAQRVIGRGKPVPKIRRSGGQARGIRPRGSQAIGELYHDHCKCRGVPVFKNNYVEMQDDAKSYFESYGDARDKVREQRQAEGYQGFGDQATSQKMILAEMRQSLGVK